MTKETDHHHPSPHREEGTSTLPSQSLSDPAASSLPTVKANKPKKNSPRTRPPSTAQVPPHTLEDIPAVPPLDIALSLLRPDEVEKLKKYVTAYMQKYHGSEG